MPMLMVMLLLATPSDSPLALGKPVGSMSDWIRDSDFRAEAAGIVRFKTIFTPEGALESCAVTASSGNKVLEHLVCSLAAKRFKFGPSLGGDGQPVYRVLERMANFSDAPAPADFVRPMVTLPVDDGLRAGKFAVIVDVDADGALKACAAEKGGDESTAARACAAIAPLWQPLIERDAMGAAIRYVRDIRIEVTASPRSK